MRFFQGGKSKSSLKDHGHGHSRARRIARRQSYLDDETSPLLSPTLPDADETETAPDGLTPPVAAVPSTCLAQHSKVASPPSSANSRIFNYQTNMVLLSYTMLAMHSTAYDQVIPVFLNYPHQTPDETNTKLPFKFSGGFDMSSGHIGTMFTVTALVSALAQFIIFPPLCSRFGELKCYRFACKPPTFFLFLVSDLPC